jgi:hypothetical protein
MDKDLEMTGLFCWASAPRSILVRESMTPGSRFKVGKSYNCPTEFEVVESSQQFVNLVFRERKGNAWVEYDSLGINVAQFVVSASR